MESELIQQLTVDDPLEVRELTLDGFEIDTVELLLIPPPENDDADEDEDMEMHSTLDKFGNLIHLSMNSTALTSLQGFPRLPKLKWLSLGDNKLSSGFDALSKADLQSLVRLDLTRNNIADESVLEPLDALGNLQHINLAENEIASRDNYREAVFNALPQLISVDGHDRDGEAIDIDEDALMASDNEGEDEDYHSDDQQGSQEGDVYEIDDNEGEQHEEEEDDEDQPIEAYDQRQQSVDEEDEDEEAEEYSDDDKENRPPTTGGKVYSEQYVDEEEEEENDEEEDEDEDERDDDELEEDEEEDIEEEEEEEEEDEDDEEEEEEEEGPGLAYLMQDNIADDQEDEEDFEPGEEPEEDDEMESSDEEEYAAGGGSSSKKHNAKGQNGGASAQAPASSTQNGSGSSHHTSPTATSQPKRPISSLEDRGEDDHDLAVGSGFDDEGTNGFGMDNFEGPATFGDDTEHDQKRMRL